MSCQLTTPLPLCISTRRLLGAGQYGRLHCTTKLSTEQVPSYLPTALNQREITVFFTTCCFVPPQVNSSISQSRKKIPTKLVWRHKRKLTFAMLERTCSTTGTKSHRRRMSYGMKQVLGSSAGREIITPSKETDLFWIRDPCTVHLKTPVLSGCPQNTTINWLTHHGTTTEMQSCEEWGARIERKIRKTILYHSNAYTHSKIPLYYNRRVAEDVGSFLGAFAKLQKATTVFVLSVCLSVRMEPGSRWTDSHKIWQQRVLYMKTYIHLWQYFVEFFLEWEMFHTKVVEEVKTLILCSITFSRESCRLWDVEKYGRIRRATYDNMAHALCVLDNYGYRHSKCELLIAFPRQQWLCESASMLCLYVNCLSCLLTRHASIAQ